MSAARPRLDERLDRDSVCWPEKDVDSWAYSWTQVAYWLGHTRTERLATPLPATRVSDLPRAPRWMADARCVDHPDVPFVLDGHGSYRRAVAICGECPAAAECLDYALTEGMAEGVWGGMTPTDRAALGYDQPRKSVVYFATGRTPGLIKIGTSGDLVKRLRDQGGLTLLATEPGSFQREASLHRRFSHLRQGGPRSEWFREAPELLEYVAALTGCASNPVAA